MKVQVCTAVVMVVAALMVGAAPGKHPLEFWINFLRRETSDVCGPDLCWPEGDACFKQMKQLNITTEQQATEVINDLNECAQAIGATKADFSTLTLEELQAQFSQDQDPAKKADEIINFMRRFKVFGRQNQYDMLKCGMTQSGELPKLKACLAATQTTSAPEDDSQTEDTQ